MMTLSKMENEILGLIGDDYEAPHTIIEEVSEMLGAGIGIPEINSVLINLVKKGLATALVYDDQSQMFKPLPPGDEISVLENLWFTSKK